jgi:hypothetical protein
MKSHTMNPRTVLAAAAALSGAALLSGCYSSRTTEVQPVPTTAAAPPSCYYSNVPYAMGARVVTPEARTIECGRDGYWHALQ